MATTINETDLVVELLQRSRKQERRDFIERIMKDIESGAPNVSWECWQQCPNTAVQVTLNFKHVELKIGLGFSKVSWPDKWDAEEGQSIALHKAVASIWRQMKKGK